MQSASTSKSKPSKRRSGHFADILCRNLSSPSDGHLVLIENQLEKTDHTHLGQLMTYGAGLQTLTIIWIAAKFTDEHRAALDWLNDITNQGFNFFGVEMELWRIGNSKVAPRFNLVSKPNDWTKSVSSAASQITTEELTETQVIQLQYWTNFRSLLESTPTQIKPAKAKPQSWTSYSIGRSDFWINVYTNSIKNVIGVLLVLSGPNAKAHFHLLHQQKDEFQKHFDTVLDWRELPDKKESRVEMNKLEDPKDDARWPQQHQWLLDRLLKFHSIFGPAIKQLNADDYNEAE